MSRKTPEQIARIEAPSEYCPGPNASPQAKLRAFVKVTRMLLEAMPRCEAPTRCGDVATRFDGKTYRCEAHRHQGPTTLGTVRLTNALYLLQRLLSEQE